MIRAEDLSYVATLVRDRSGIVLGPDKDYLIESRLMPLARRRGFSQLGPFLDLLRRGTDREAFAAVVEAMTTNESSFFRDVRPFEQLTQVMLPALRAARAGKRRLRIWSAACSTGQEPISLAISLREAGEPAPGWQLEIVATDLSEEVLGRARAGVFSQFDVQRGLTIQRLMRWFSQIDDRWRVKDEISRLIRFERHNLMDDGRRLGEFDIVFLRNVLIYFDVELKRRILESIGRMLPPDGYLVLGGTETVLGVTDRLVALPTHRGLYAPAPR